MDAYFWSSGEVKGLHIGWSWDVLSDCLLVDSCTGMGLTGTTHGFRGNGNNCRGTPAGISLKEMNDAFYAAIAASPMVRKNLPATSFEFDLFIIKFVQ